MNEKIYRKGNNVCIEREGIKLWFNKRLINKMITFHEKQLNSFYEARRHLITVTPDTNQPCAICEGLKSDDGAIFEHCPKCGRDLRR